MRHTHQVSSLAPGRTHDRSFTSASRGAALIKTLGVILGVGAVSLGAWVALGRGGTGESVKALDLHTVAVESFEVTAAANGELRARNQTVLRSMLKGPANIVEIVEEGSKVSQGDVLCKLNDDEIRSELEDEVLQRETARADLISAESALQIQLTENEANLRKAKTDVLLAEIELQKFEAGDVVEKRLELNLAVEKGTREVRRLTEKTERSRQLFANDFLSKDELELDELALVEAQAELRKANVALEAYEQYTYGKERKKLESDLDQAKSELEKTIRTNESEQATKEADATNKKRQLELREAKVAELEDELKHCELLAPTDGLVVYATSLEQFSWMNNEQPLNVGTQINPNQEIIMLPDTSEMIAAVKVHESLVGRIKPGQRTSVMIDAAQGKRFEGTVESIGIMARSGGWRDPNVREYEVRISLDLPDQSHGLKPSMRCEARIVLQQVDEALAAPLPAVFTDGPNQFVYVSDGAKYKQTQVRVGRRSDTTAEILSGLTNGQKIALREPTAGSIIKAVFEAPAGRGAAQARGPGGGKGPRGQGAKPAQPDGGAASTEKADATSEPAETAREGEVDASETKKSAGEEAPAQTKSN